MGDRTSVTLTVPAVYKDAALAIAKANDDDPGDSFENGGGVNAQNPHNLYCFCFYEVNYGDLQFLDQLMEAGIPFDSDWDAGSEYGAGCETCRFTHDGEAIRKSFSNDYMNPDLGKLMALLDKPEETKAFILDHYNNVTSMPWDDQVENAKVYRLRRLITPKDE